MPEQQSRAISSFKFEPAVADRQFEIGETDSILQQRDAGRTLLTFAKPKALSKKAGDDWTVPLCALHHRELHDAGDERRWWRAKRIDAASMASELWRQRQNGPDGDAEHSAAIPRIQ